MRTTASTALICWALASCPDSVAGAPLTAFRAAKESFALYEPIFVEVSVENSEGREIRVDLGKNRKGHLVFDVISPDGSQHDDLRLPDPGAGSTGGVAVAPGETYRQQVLLNEWFPFREPGTYRVFARVDGGSPSTLLIRIEPRDDKALHVVCSDLVQRILQAKGHEQLELARAFSYIEDPVAVPYVARMLSADALFHSQYLLLVSLERIGTPAAAEVLISTLKSKDEDSRDLARDALSRLAGQTSNEALRDRIRSALRGDP